MTIYFDQLEKLKEFILLLIPCLIYIHITTPRTINIFSIAQPCLDLVKKKTYNETFVMEINVSTVELVLKILISDYKMVREEDVLIEFLYSI